MVRRTGIRVFLAKEMTMKALSAVRRFIRDERGVTAIEYGLIAALLAVVMATVLTPVGTQIKSVFNSVLTSLGGTAVS